MAMIHWVPLDEMSSLQNQIDRIFEPSSTHEKKQSLKHFLPVEVTEKPDQYRIKLRVPGIDPSQIKVESTPKKMVIRAETQPKSLDKDETAHLSEFHYGQFSRCLGFPVAVVPEKIEAEYAFGILTIKAPKEQAVQCKQIEIKVNHG